MQISQVFEGNKSEPRTLEPDLHWLDVDEGALFAGVKPTQVRFSGTPEVAHQAFHQTLEVQERRTRLHRELNVRVP